MTNTTTGAARFASALSTNETTAAAIAEACDKALSELNASVDLAVCFVSHDHGPDFAAIVKAIAERVKARVFIGCTGESIAGVGQEIEQSPAVSLWLAHLPGVNLRPLRLEFQRTPDGGTFTGWPDDLPEAWPADSTLMLLGEPFSFPADSLLERLQPEQPGVRIVGGMASGAHGPGENQVFLDGEAFNAGAVGVLIDGNVRVRTVVSQGCRPIGRPMVVTKAEANMIHQLGGRPTMQQLQEVFDALDPETQKLVQSGLHVGLVINEYQERFDRGDFLVRNVVGVDRATGGIAIGDYVRVGQTAQFHVRDAASADEDLRSLLSGVERPGEPHSTGALLFTCNGRGTRLFPEPHHDAQAVERALGPVPLAGFFAQGEIGPVGGKNFLHGFTASVVIFSPGA
jgi:small ligand-binding sensory domain FIST